LRSGFAPFGDQSLPAHAARLVVEDLLDKVFAAGAITTPEAAVVEAQVEPIETER